MNGNFAPPQLPPPPPQLMNGNFAPPQLHLKIPEYHYHLENAGVPTRRTPPLGSPYFHAVVAPTLESPHASDFTRLTPRALYVDAGVGGDTTELSGGFPLHPRQMSGTESPVMSPMAPPELGGGSGSFVMGSRVIRPKSKLKRLVTR